MGSPRPVTRPMILAIDPGPVESAWVLWDGEAVRRKYKGENAPICDAILTGLLDAEWCVIEKVASYGMPVGAEVFETVFWSGRFAQAFYSRMKLCYRLTRGEVKMHLCHSMKAKDSNIRQALIDRFGAPGTKKAPGLTYGLSGDTWAAFALAVTWMDRQVMSGEWNKREL